MISQQCVPLLHHQVDSPGGVVGSVTLSDLAIAATVVERMDSDEGAVSANFLSLFIEAVRVECVKDEAEARYRDLILSLKKASLDEKISK